MKAWREGLRLSNPSANRTLTALKAALNLAVTNRRVDPGAAREWGDVGPHKGANKRRDLFLDLAQRRALLGAAADGKPWAHSDWDELVREAAKSAALPKGTCLYTLRHSFITQAITDGMTTLDVARRVGTSVMMIEKHYGHLVASAARERLAKVQMV